MKYAMGLVAALALVSCKPPKFDESITCEQFSAHGVAVYQYQQQDTIYVLYPDRHLVRLVAQKSCVITEP